MTPTDRPAIRSFLAARRQAMTDLLAAVVRNITRPDVAPPRGALDWDLRSHSFLLTPAQRARGLSHLGSNERLRLALHRAVTRE